MMNYIKQLRKSLTLVELEAGSKHPERPDFKIMTREIEEMEFTVQKMKKEVKELSEW